MSDDGLSTDSLRTIDRFPTDGPWSYRPLVWDDWGIVRGPKGWIVARARAGRQLSEDEKSAYRRDGTDPYEANARLIAAAPRLVEAAINLMAMIDPDGDSTDIWCVSMRRAIRDAYGKGAP